LRRRLLIYALLLGALVATFPGWGSPFGSPVPGDPAILDVPGGCTCEALHSRSEGGYRAVAVVVDDRVLPVVLVDPWCPLHGEAR